MTQMMHETAIFHARTTRSLRAMLMAGATAAAVFAANGVAAQTDPTPQQQTTQAAQSTDPNAKATAPSPADTQQSALDSQEIVVTGSRIVRAAVTAQPAEVLGADQIAKRGYTNLGNALQELPAFSVPANSPIGSQGSFGAGQTFVNLYNLGAQRTLSLVDGHRFVTSATSSIFGAVAGSPVDFSSLPPNLVERTEVVSVGGAPIYGSDAIAGTVNVILKKDFDGLQVTGETGLATQHHDGADYNASILGGKNFSEGRGNITLNVNYDRQRGIPTADRYYLGADSPFFDTALDPSSPYALQLYNGGEHYSVFTNTGMPLVDDGYPIISGQPYSSITNAAGQALYFNDAGKLVPFKDGQVTGNSIAEAGGDGFRIADYDNFLTDSQRIQATMLAHFDVSDHFKLSGEAWYGRNRSTNLRAQPFYNTALFADAGDTNGNLILSTDNPYLSSADRATIISNLTAAGEDPSTFYLARANTDLATGSFRTLDELYRFVGGASGDFSLGSHSWNWEVTANYGHDRATTSDNEVVTQNYYNALDAVRDSSGNIVCRPGYTSANIATISSTCAPLDLFGVNQASQAAIDYITAPAKSVQTNTQLDLIADVNGSIITLPAGDAKVSVGFEHRREHTAFDPGTFYYGEPNADGTRTQFGNSIPIDPVSGSYHTNEEFAELDIPVVSADMHIPLIHSLNLQGAGRHVDNSLNGSFWTYTGGGTYAPIRDITFRGNYTRSFRSPSISEAFAPIGQVFDTANDPCDSKYIGGGPDPSRRAANCAAEGITQPFVSDVTRFTAKGTFGGNPHLGNEVANSWTAGAVLSPTFLKGFSASADYISIDVKNEIASLSLTDLMNACYDATDYPSNPFCSTFTRDADHQVTSFAEGNYNIGIEHFRALQAEISYDFKLSAIGLPENAGALGLSVNYLHTFSHYTKVGTGDKEYSLNTTQEPKDNITANFNYNNGGFDFLWQTMYYSRTDVDPNQPETTYQYPTIHPFWMFNTSAGYAIDKQYTLRFIVDNVLNKHVPFPYSVSETRYYSAIMGRYARISVTAKF